MKKVIDMRHGNPAEALILFSIPFFMGSIFQQLYSTADFLFVGNLIGKNSAAAVGASSILVTCLIGLFMGISVGTGVTVSQSVGEENARLTERMGHTAIVFSVLFGIILTVIGEAAAEHVLRLLGTPQQIMREALVYIRLYFFGMLPMILYNVGSGILRACGDSRTPFYVMAAGGILNVIADWITIRFLHMGIIGAAIATIVSQSFSALCIMINLYKGNGYFRLKKDCLRVDQKALKKILSNGLPAGFQSMLITFSNIIVQYHINAYGTDAIAAFATYFKLENFTYIPAAALGQAATTFAGQNMGAGDHKRIRKGMCIASAISFLIVEIIALFLLAIGQTSVGWFVKDETVIGIGLKIISVTFPFYGIYAVMEVLSGTVRGIGKAFSSMIIILVSVCGFRILLLSIFDYYLHEIPIVASVYPITWCMALIGMLGILIRFFNRFSA